MADFVLADYLNGFQKNLGGEPTHIMGKTKLWVPDDKLGDFWNAYLSSYIAQPIQLGEFTNNTTVPLSLMVRLEFMHDVDDCRPLIVSIVYNTQQIIRRNFKITDDSQLVCISSFYDYEPEDGHRHFGYNLKFPHVRIEKNQIADLVLPQLFNRLDVEGAKRRLEHDPRGSWEYIISFYSDLHPLYGSVVHNDLCYEFEVVYPQIDYQAVQNEEDIPGSELGDIFNIDTFEPAHRGLLSPEFVARFATDLMDNDAVLLPLLCSIGYGSRILQLQDLAMRPREPNLAASRGVDSLGDDDYGIAVRMLDMLGPGRLNNRHYWLDIGRALYNITEQREISGNDPNLGLEKWIRVTQRSSNFVEADCREMYYTFESERSGVGVKTIAWYAKKDNPEAYGKWHQEWCKKAIIATTSDDEISIAEVFYRSYWLDFVTDFIGEKVSWYVYKNHSFRLAPKAHEAVIEIMDRFHSKFEVYRAKLTVKKSTTNNPKDAKEIEFEIAEITKIIKKIKTESFLNKLLRYSSHKFLVRDFTRLRDNNPSLLGMKNGVIEIIDDKAIFREGKPEDYITKSTHLMYRTYDDTEKGRKLLIDWFTKLWPDTELLHNTLKWMSSILYGRNSAKIFPILTGEGDNGKSMLRKLWQAALGDYFFSFESDVITQGRKSSSSASPNTAAADKCRLVVIDEPDADEQIKSGFWKKATGGDDFFTRKLYADGGHQAITYLMVMLCNKIPPVENPDEAAKSRVMIVPHLSRWPRKGPVPETVEEQWRQLRFKPDPYFEKNMAMMAGPLIDLLVRYYPFYKKEGLSTPKIVEKYTRDYWAENDPYYIFTKEVVENVYVINPETRERVLDKDGQPVQDINARVNLSAVYRRYIDWFKDFQPNRRYALPSCPVVRYNLEQRWGKMDAENTWGGMRLKEAGGPKLFSAV